MAKSARKALYCPFCHNPVKRGARTCPFCSAEPEPSGWPEDPHVDRTLEERFQIDQRLSADGMAITFRAWEVKENRAVLLKMLHPDRAADPEVWQSFVEHIQLAQDLNVPECVSILYVGMDMEHNDVPYFVHEIVKGETLAELLARDLAFDTPEALKIGRHVALGMAQAHGKGIFHRHLRPEKIIVLGVREAKPIKILDLGFASVSPKDEVTTPDLVDALRYMPPEGDEDDPHAGTDIHALGVMLFEMITGQAPPSSKGTGTTSGDLIRMKDLAPSSPDDLDTLVHDMMARDPERRPADMAGVIKQIDRIDDELSTETIDSLVPEGAEHVEKAPPVIHKPSVGTPSPVAKHPAHDEMTPRRIIGGERYSAEIFSRPTKPPKGGPAPKPAARKRTPSPKKPDEPSVREKDKSLAALFAARNKDDDKPSPEPPKVEKVKAKAVPPPPVDLDEVLPPPAAPEPEVRAEVKSDYPLEDITEEVEVLEVEDVEEVAPEAPPTVEPPAEERQRPSAALLAGIAGGAVVLIGVLVLAGWMIGSGGHPKEEDTGKAGSEKQTQPPPQEEPPQLEQQEPPPPEPPPVEEVKPPDEPPVEEPVEEQEEPATKKEKKKDKEKDGKKGKRKKWELLFTGKKKPKKKKESE